MNKLTENQEKWLTALESGKYKQVTGRLRSSDCRYCCLGVACEVAKGDLNADDLEYALEHQMIAPFDVVEWLGLYSKVGDIVGETEDECHLTLAGLNDIREWSFAKIAEWVRANPEKVFKTKCREIVRT